MTSSRQPRTLVNRGERGAVVALLFLSLINLLNYYDRMLVVVVSEPLRLEFDLTDTQYGILTGPAFVLVYALGSLFFGYQADRRNRRNILVLVLGLWSVTTALCGLATNFLTLALARAGVSIGEAGSNPAGMSMLSDHYPPQRRSMALAIFAVGGMLGLFLSFVLGSWINEHYGWRVVFLIAGVPGIILAIATLLRVDEPLRGRFDQSRPDQLSYAEGLRCLVANPAFVWLCIAASLGAFSSLGMMVWLPQFFIRTHGLSVQEVGLLFGPAAALGLCAGMIAGGWFANHLAQRSLARPVTICVVSTFAVAPLYLTVLWTHSVVLALVATFAAMALSVFYAPAYQAAIQNVCQTNLRATAAAVSNVLIAVVGQGLLPLGVGLMSDAFKELASSAALQWSLTVAQVFVLLAGTLFVVARARTHSHFNRLTTKHDLTVITS